MKNLITMTLIAMMAVNFQTVSGQCTISPHTEPGFYPTPVQGIHPAAAGESWALNMTIVVPKDTTIVPYGTLNIDSATVQGFIGFPSSFQYYYNTPSQWIKGNDAGCMLIYGTPASTDVGTHSISLIFKAMVFGFAFSDTITDYWQFEIKDSTHQSVNNPLSGNRDITVYPNPAGDHIMILSGEAANAEVMIFDATGQLKMKTEAQLSAGAPFRVSLDHFRPGIYLVSIRDAAGNFRTRKVTVL